MCSYRSHDLRFVLESVLEFRNAGLQPGIRGTRSFYMLRCRPFERNVPFQSALYEILRLDAQASSRKSQSGLPATLAPSFFACLPQAGEEALFDVQCFSDAAGAAFASPRTTRNPTYSGAGVQFDFASAGQSALPPITFPFPSRVNTHSATFPPRS
jgi:hypothetical protein